jgi:tetratricopeptide (TPR) repeat protein
MKRTIVFFLIYAAAILLFTRCSNETDRQIKLAPQPLGAMMQDKVKTVQIAIEEKKKVAVIAFENQTNMQEANWMSIGLLRMLNSSLVQSRQLVITPANATNDALSKLDLGEDALENSRACQRLADVLKAEAIVSGAYRIKDDSLTIQVVLHDGRDGGQISTFSSVARLRDMESLASAIAKLSWQIRSTLEDKNDSIPEVSRSLADVSTNSLEAYKYYLDGLALLEQFMMPQAMGLFSKAIELDSTFASAYLNLAHTMLALGLFKESKPILKRAVDLAEYVPERERLPILAMNAMINGEPYKAIEIYNRAVELFPEDDEVHYELGNYYFSLVHDYQKAIEKYETTIELNPKHKLAYNQLAYCYAAVGEMEHSAYILEKYAELAPDEPNPYDSAGEISQREGRLDDAIDKYKMALKINPQYWHSRIHLATAYQDAGKFRKAKSLLKKVLKDSIIEKQRRNTEELLAYNHILTGKIDQAEKIFQHHIKLNPGDPSAVFALLRLRPEHEPYRQLFSGFVQAQLDSAIKRELSVEYLFPMISMALRCNLAIDKIDQILNLEIANAGDPIMRQAALSYKLIIDFQKGRESFNTGELLANASMPEAFQRTNPISWNDYWQHYFNSLKIAQQNNINIRAWAAGFNEFAHQSKSTQFELNGHIAVAAAEFYTGDQSAAEEMLNNYGFPCERDWKLLGPFKMRHGFDEKFWPEKKSIEVWAPGGNTVDASFTQRDDLFDGYINLKYLGETSFNDAMYAVLHISSPTFKEAQLRFGLTGRLKVWLNDNPVMIKNRRSKAIIDQYSANVQLRPGSNWMLVRLNNAFGDLGFYFRLTDKEGDGLERVQFSAPVEFADTKPKILNGEKKGA